MKRVEIRARQKAMLVVLGVEDFEERLLDGWAVGDMMLLKWQCVDLGTQRRTLAN